MKRAFFDTRKKCYLNLNILRNTLISVSGGGRTTSRPKWCRYSNPCASGRRRGGGEGRKRKTVCGWYDMVPYLVCLSQGTGLPHKNSDWCNIKLLCVVVSVLGRGSGCGFLWFLNAHFFLLWALLCSSSLCSPKRCNKMVSHHLFDFESNALLSPPSFVFAL